MRFLIAVALVAILLISNARVPSRAASNGIPIQHIIVIVQENHTFDNYFGTYPGANGLPPGVALPANPNGTASVKPFPLNRDAPWGDICHSWGCAHAEFDSGKYDAEIRRDMEDGETYGIEGTPTIFINGVILTPTEFSADGLRAAIERALKRAPASRGQ